MADLTTDPFDPRLKRGEDKEPGEQNDAYLILPQVAEEFREKTFVRPVRTSYVHMGIDPVVEGYVIVKYGKGGCGTLTRMSQEIAETYARNPSFYGSTWCMGCKRHIAVKEFWWDDHYDPKDRVVGS